MKTTFTLLFGFLFAVSAHAQGSIAFANAQASPDTRFYTNDFQGHSGFTTGANQYLFGLYTAPNGTTDESLFVLRLTATNRSSPFSGLFNNTPTGPAGIAGIPIGTQIAFQVRGWSFHNGGLNDTYENASSGFDYRGKTAIGFVTASDPTTSGPAIIFGTGPGQIGTPTCLGCIPEPSSTALFLLGGCVALTSFVFRISVRRRRPN